jgi:hypothetical protein
LSIILVALVVPAAFAAEAKYLTSLDFPRLQTQSQQARVQGSTELLGWQWMPASTTSIAAPFIPGGSVVSALASATPLGFVLPDGTKISARTTPPSQFHCQMEPTKRSAAFVDAVMRGLTFPSATIALREAGGNRRSLFSIKLSGIRIGCVSFWQPSATGKEVQFAREDETRPIQVVVLHCDKTELQMTD